MSYQLVLCSVVLYVFTLPYMYMTEAPPVTCGTPRPPSNGSVNLGNQSLPYAGTTVTFQCNDGLFPNDARNTTCTDMSGMGEWVPDPADLDCRINPGKYCKIFYSYCGILLILCYGHTSPSVKLKQFKYTPFSQLQCPR